MTDSDSDTSSDAESPSDDDESELADDDQLDVAELQQQILQLQMQNQQLQGLGQAGLQTGHWNLPPPGGRAAARNQAARKARQLAALGLDPVSIKKAKKEKAKKKKRGSKLEFKRVDQLWDSTIHNYKLTDTNEDDENSEYDQYLFNVRRTFDWEGKFKVH